MSFAVNNRMFRSAAFLMTLSQDLVEIGGHLLGDDGGKGTLAHARRSDQQGVVELLAVHLGGVECDPHLVDYATLPDQVRE